jgi:hypothetical protein
MVETLRNKNADIKRLQEGSRKSMRDRATSIAPPTLGAFCQLLFSLITTFASK